MSPRVRFACSGGWDGASVLKQLKAVDREDALRMFEPHHYAE